MRLANAACYFDRMVCEDAYDPSAPTFKGQFDLFDDTKRDGLTAERRILSAAPNVEIPLRRVITTGGHSWLIGNDMPDMFADEVIRNKYVLHRADSLAVIKTFDQILTGAAGTAAYASRVWVKGSKQVDTDSTVFDEFDIYFSPSEAVQDKHMVLLEGAWHLVRAVYPTQAGLVSALSEELPNPLESGTLNLRTYAPVTDTYTSSPLAVSVLRIRWQVNFTYRTVGTPTYLRGDESVVLLKSAAMPKVGDTLSLGDGTWRVQGVLDEGLCWNLHTRRA